MDFCKVIAEGTVEELIESISEERKISLEFNQYLDWIVPILEQVDGVKKVGQKENTIQVSLKKDEQYLSNLMQVMVSNTIQPKSITTEKANLETVFLQLTGKKLRD